MMKVLADAELIFSAFQENEHTKDAEKLLTRIMPSEQIELCITNLCLSKIGYYDEYTASFLEERFRDNILLCDNCLIIEQVFQSIENTRNFECTVEKACAIAYGVGAVVTHKTEDFAGGDLLVWSVTELLTLVDGQVPIRRLPIARVATLVKLIQLSFFQPQQYCNSGNPGH